MTLILAFYTNLENIFMQIKKIVLGLSLACLAMTTSYALEVKPGEWEVETTAKADTGVEMPAMKQKICITPEMASNYGNQMAAKDAPPGCQVEVKENAADKMTFVIECEQQGMKVNMDGSINKISDEQIDMGVLMTMAMGDQKQSFTTNTVQKFVSENCSADAAVAK